MDSKLLEWGSLTFFLCLLSLFCGVSWGRSDVILEAYGHAIADKALTQCK